ncbi:MAG: hypothetical protein ACREN8_11015, partial [Candidatus Dormibacteraceae bacterium]
MRSSEVRQTRTKSVRLSADEAQFVKDGVEMTGEVEASFLRRELMRGVRAERIERGVTAFVGGMPTYLAAQAAGMGRFEFIQELLERGIPLSNQTSESMFSDLLET